MSSRPVAQSSAYRIGAGLNTRFDSIVAAIFDA